MLRVVGWCTVVVVSLCVAAVIASLIGHTPTMKDLADLANSQFTTALIGSLAGAFAGAVAAQRAADRSRAREELLREIRNTNAALTLTFAICNATINFKKQLVNPVWDTFQSDREEHLRQLAQLRAGTLPRNFEIDIVTDMRLFPPQELPSQQLQKQCYEKLSLNGRGLMLPLALTNALIDLNRSIVQRNAIIEGFKRPDLPARELAALYFGLPIERNGQHLIREEYKSTLEAIHNQTDDAIFFSRLLCRDLNAHGVELVREYEHRAKINAPRINNPEFKIAEDAGLMPKDDAYRDWINWGKKPEQVRVVD